MPLIVMSGYPSSGKSRKAFALKEYIETKIKEASLNLDVFIIDDEHLGFDKLATYKEEKKLRGSILSSTDRYLSKSTFVIVDSMNYIKGLRYQLYCIARATGTTHCTVYCGVQKEVCKKFNESSIKPYNSQTLKELIMRFEEPDSAGRWDYPLFTTLPDDSLSLHNDQIWDHLVNNKAKSVNKANICRVSTTGDYLYELDNSTNLIIKYITEHQKLNNSCIKIKVPSIEQQIDTKGTNLSLIQLRKFKRQFVDLNKFIVINDINRIPSLFVDYINKSI